MAVAKRQREGKPVKIEHRNVWGLEWGPQVKQTALLANPIYLRQAQEEEKKHKKRNQNWARGSLLFACFGLAFPHTPKVYFPLLCKPNHGAVTLVHLSLQTFVVTKAKPREWHTPPTILKVIMVVIFYILYIINSHNIMW